MATDSDQLESFVDVIWTELTSYIDDANFFAAEKKTGNIMPTRGKTFERWLAAPSWMLRAHRAVSRILNELSMI